MKTKRVLIFVLVLLLATLACRLPEVIRNGETEPMPTTEPFMVTEVPYETVSPPGLPTQDLQNAIILNANGTGDYPSLEVAIAEAPRGAVIKLQPGTYYLSVVLNITQAVTLVGSGPDVTTVIGVQSDNTLQIDTFDTVTLSDISFSFEGSGRGTIIRATDATLNINNCRIANGHRSDDYGGNGMFLDGQTTAFIQSSRIEDNDLHGIELDDNASLTLQDSYLLNNGQDGVVFFSYSMGTLTGNEISNNGLHGVGVNNDAFATLMNNTFSYNAEVGIRVSDNANVTITQNELTYNGLSGIVVRDFAQATIEANDVSYNNETGVVFFDDATGTVTNNELTHNTLHGVSAKDQASPLIQGNNCSDNTEAGIRITETSAPTITDNTCNNNGLSGIIVTDSAAPSIYGNTLMYNGDAGIAFLKEAFGDASNNICTYNRYGIYVAETANSTYTANDCSNNSDADIEDKR